MKFLDWLFGKGWDTPKDTVGEDSTEKEFEAHLKKQFEQFRPVPKWTHAGKAGKTIYCPECGNWTHVHNFAWSALVCDHCRATIKKHDWLLPAKWESEYLRKKYDG